jgi:hypothetical protein
MGNRLRVYFQIMRFCLASTRQLNLGDYVQWNGSRWSISNGVSRPRWALCKIDGGDYRELVHESEFKKERSLRNFVHDVTLTWRFYRGYWVDIWLRGLNGDSEAMACIRRHMPVPQKRSP